jgi:hypothetical protein
MAKANNMRSAKRKGGSFLHTACGIDICQDVQVVSTTAGSEDLTAPSAGHSHPMGAPEIYSLDPGILVNVLYPMLNYLLYK